MGFRRVRWLLRMKGEEVQNSDLDSQVRKIREKRGEVCACIKRVF